jgi:hypothetical protein
LKATHLLPPFGPIDLLMAELFSNLRLCEKLSARDKFMRWGASFWPRLGQEEVLLLLIRDLDQPLQR